MFARFKNARTALSRPVYRSVITNARAASTSRLTADLLNPTNEVAEKLHETGLWAPGRKRKSTPPGEKHRLNIVNDGLCDDIMRYLAPSLQRHHGCDLIDINPGAGVWSRKLHEVVQPRKHIMMEKDVELYEPFLKDLAAKDNVEIVAKSGIVWKDLNEMLREHLPNQVEVDKTATPERNDTLLVSVNLAMYPPKAFQSFECVSTMVQYQFMSSIRTSSLFQKYGLVRMLVWINDDGKRKLLPRSIVRRKRSAFEADLSCEWIHEIAGKDLEVESRTELRDEWINLESGFQTLERMKKLGLTPPPGRETAMYKTMMESPELAGRELAGVERPRLNRPFRQELEELEAAYMTGVDETALKRLKSLRFREKYDQEDGMVYLELLQERAAVSRMNPSSTQFARNDAAWNSKVQSLKKNARNEFIMLRDNHHLFRQSPPSLLWDQRPYEPLAVDAEDFFPNVPCALLDFQPQAMHPLLRQHGTNTSRTGDMSDLMLRFWFTHSLIPASKAMDGIWPGFGDLFDQCKSLSDVTRGGSPMSDEGQVSARAINKQQWVEILETFAEWPFRPTYEQLVGRLVEDFDPEDTEDESKSSAQGIA